MTEVFCHLQKTASFNQVAFINSLGPSDAIWRQRTRTILAQVMACCLRAPSQYLNQCWLIMNLMLWHPPQNNFIGISQNINSINEFVNYNFKIIATFPRGQWVKRAFHPGCRYCNSWCSSSNEVTTTHLKIGHSYISHMFHKLAITVVIHNSHPPTPPIAVYLLVQ